MKKTKLGISVGLMGAIVAMLGLVGGYVITVIVVGYILWKEEDMWLKKQGVRTLLLMLVFSAFSTLLNLFPEVMEFVRRLLELFDGYAPRYESWFDNLLSILRYAADIIKVIVFALLAWKGLSMKSLNISALEKGIEKHMD